MKIIFYSPSLISWKCTLCQDFLKYFNLRERNMTCHINSFGRKVIERILLELYCQNEDSEHYRDCLNREIVRYTNIKMFVNKIHF